jgi:aspartate dehydrogenase
MKKILLIGYGAMARAVGAQLRTGGGVDVPLVLERGQRRESLARELGDATRVVASVDEIDELPDLAVECAGHEAVGSIVPALLQRGVPTIIASIGALAREGVSERLEQAAQRGRTQVHLIPGALAGIDALAAARTAGLDEVRYIGRKPPTAWLGTPCEREVDLHSLRTATVIFEGDARSAARLYPKNANVAAVVALAGIGFERTRVQLVADPGVTRNVHAIEARGTFGELAVTVQAQTLAGNPKTSALAAYSIVRAVRNQVQAVTL